MELQRGTCLLCLDRTSKVLSTVDTQKFTNLIPQVLSDAVMNHAEFDIVKDQLKMCPICCYKLSIISATKREMDEGESGDNGVDGNCCFFCRLDRNLVAVDCMWKYFSDRTDGLYDLKDWKSVCVCPNCLFYLDTAFTIRTKLFLKYPQLKTNPSSASKRTNSTPKSPSTSKQNHKKNDSETPKRKSDSDTTPPSKRRKIFKNCFDNLTPVSKSNYQATSKVQQDPKLYNKIAYVNLGDESTEPVRAQPKERPKIKIKLIKPKNKKDRIVIISHKTDDKGHEQGDLNKHSIKKRAYVSLSKKQKSNSENVHVSKRKARRRHSSYVDEPKKDESDQNLEDTPKTSNSNSAPKRRTSLFTEDADETSENAETTNEDKIISQEAISNIVNKYLDDSVNGTLNEDVPENGISNNGEQDSEDQWNVDKTTENEDEKQEHQANTIEEKSEGSEEKDSETNSDSNEEDTNQENVQSDDLPEKPTDGDTNIINSGADAIQTSENGSDKDSVGSTERKKKHVTFSDDIQ